MHNIEVKTENENRVPCKQDWVAHTQSTERGDALNLGGYRGHPLTCLHVWAAQLRGMAGQVKKSCINGALIFGRTEVTIVVKTISIKATKLQKEGNEAEKRFNNRLKGIFSPVQ